MGPLGAAPAEPAAVMASTLRWFERVVIGLNLCPFAKGVHVKRQIRWLLSPASQPAGLMNDLEQELSLLTRTQAEQLETTVLIHPYVLADFLEYTAFLKQAERKLTSLGLDGIVQIASFHPAYEFADAPAGDISHFSNRSPYPMLHLLREASVTRAVGAFPNAAQIYQTNIATLKQLGPAGWRQLLLDESPPTNGAQ